MSAFLRELRERNTDPSGRRWLWVPYDQLTDELGPLAHEDPGRLGIVLVENAAKARRRPYHKMKLAHVLANQRQFALEQAGRGVAVRYLFRADGYAPALREVASELGVLQVMEPAERELRAEIAQLPRGMLEQIPHEGWLTTTEQFRQSQKSELPPWRMDAFYRHVRQQTGILMEDGKPEGGKYSFDPDNRKPWHGEPPAPEPPRFRPDEVTREVEELIERSFARHPGALDISAVPATLADARRLWRWAKRECLPTFGPYEDAMSTESSGLFHTRVAPLVNLHRLTPARIVRDVARSGADLPSREGFVRQVLGWREFVRHVHLATDGFRNLPRERVPVREHPGDGGWSRWSGTEWSRDASSRATAPPAVQPEPDGGATPSSSGADEALPPAFWGAESGLACLDTVVREVWSSGYSHHITRLMVLSNLATLLDVSPRELTDWFWVAYSDAYDWVVEPNVLGMGTFALGELMTTKPYVSGAAYIDRMSDYCKSCRFDPRRTCPVTSLYWAYLARHESQLASLQRMRLPLASAAKRSRAQRSDDKKVFECVRDKLARGEQLAPHELRERTG